MADTDEEPGADAQVLGALGALASKFTEQHHAVYESSGLEPFVSHVLLSFLEWLAGPENRTALALRLLPTASVSALVWWPPPE